MKTAMESIKEMVDVNTVIGDPVETQEGIVIIPVSRVAFGFAAGGSEFSTLPEGRFVGRGRQGGGSQAGGGNGQGGGGQGGDGQGGGNNGSMHPFGGGSGAGVSVQPVGFLIVGLGSIRLLTVDGGVVDKLLDMAPQLVDRLGGAVTAPQGGGVGQTVVGGGVLGALRQGVHLLQPARAGRGKNGGDGDSGGDGGDGGDGGRGHRNGGRRRRRDDDDDYDE